MMDAEQLARELDMPVEKVRKALASLEAKGLVQASIAPGTSILSPAGRAAIRAATSAKRS